MLFIFFFFLTQKLAPSIVLNAIIFGIDEQCNLIFEIALFTNCKTYIIFFIQMGPTFFSSWSFSFPFLPYLTISLLFLSFCSMSLPSSLTKSRLEHQAKPVFFIHSTLSLSALSFSFLSHFFLLSTLSVLRRCGSPMIVLR